MAEANAAGEHYPQTPARLIAGMTLAAMLAPLGSTMIAVALPAIGHDLGADAGALTQWLAASYLIVALGCQSPGGKLGDRFGYPRALGFGMLVYAMGTTLGFVVAQFEALVVARVLMAAGGAAIVPAAMAIINNRIPIERRATAFGLFGSMMGVAAALGPLVGGALVNGFGWRAIFAAPLPVLVAAWLLIPRVEATTVSRDRPEKRPRFDIAGSVLLALGLGLAVSAVRVSVSPWVGGLGLAVLVSFGLWERRAAEPVVDFSLFRSRVFVAGGMVVALHNLVMYALLFQLPIFFQRVRNIEAAEVGASLGGLMLAMVVFSAVGGRLSNRVSARLTTFLGSGLTLLGFVLASDFESLATPSAAILGLIVMGAGIGLATAPSQAAAMSAAGRARSGMAAGLLSTLRYLGGVIGISVLGHFLSGDASQAVAAHAAVRPLFLCVLVLSALVSLSLPGRRRVVPTA